MLFYSFEFLYLFLPLVILGYFLTVRFFGHRSSLIFLVLASFIFYANWNINHVWILGGSILANYCLGRYLQQKNSKLILTIGIILNLCVLGYYKYTNFFVDSISSIADTSWHVEAIILPLALSFYTFQQIAWLVDSFTKKVKTETESFWRYALFVSFFPQLIAGPIVHHSEMMPQFSKKSTFRINWKSMSVGLSIFAIGLIKKVVIADNMAAISTPIFTDAASGSVPLIDAWLGSLCFTLQIYFDFSGYSDMAIGLARMFNIRLPMNFNSPLRAASMADLWQKWHMTMTRFFQAYVHTPISMYFARKQIQMNIRGNIAIYLSTFITFVAIGFWHGANWTFIVFGIMHGVFVVTNHVWRGFRKKRKISPIPLPLSIGITFFFFMLSCVTYRAESLNIASTMYKSMFTVDITSLTEHLNDFTHVAYLLPALVIAFVFPNTQQIMQKYNPVINMADYTKVKSFWSRFLWRPTALWFLCIFVFYICSFVTLWKQSISQEFIYFQF